MRRRMPPGAREGLKNKRRGIFPSALDLQNMDEATRKKMADGFRTLRKIAEGETKPPIEESVIVEVLDDDGRVFTPEENARMIRDAERRQREDMKRSGADVPAGED